MVRYVLPKVYASGETEIWNVPVTHPSTGAAVPLAEVASLTLSLTDDLGNTINSRAAQDVLNAHGITFDADGLTWSVAAADTTPAVVGPRRHVGTFVLTLLDGEVLVIQTVLQIAPSRTAYSSPTPTMIRTYTDVNPDIEELTEAELDARLAELTPAAETETALSVGEPEFDADDLSARKVMALQAAVCFRAAAEYLRGIAARKVTGTQDPLLMEEAGRIREQADAFESRAQAYDLLFQGIAEGVERRRPTAQVLVAGVEPASICVSPADRLRNLDERSNWPAGTARGGRWR